MEFTDRQLTCVDCSQPFTFTAGEQEFYERKGFREEPKRCKPCREARKVRRSNGGGNATAGLDGGGGGGGGSNGGYAAPREPNGNRSPRGGREMFDVVCASCGQQARVPFRPVPGRPVYCRDCYHQRSGG